MRYILFLLYAVMMVLIAVMVGCSNQPLDVLLDQSGKHSSDIVDEVAGCYTVLAVDAENGEYLAIFDKKCVDAVLGMEAETEAVTDSVTLTDIVSDVAVNGVDSTYKGQTVTI